MTDHTNSGSGTQGTRAPDGARPRSDRWIRRPRRSTGDRKIAGVAGGLGRAFGIDPILIRVAFVVLTIFGGVGGLLYVLGWLLLASDGDEVSAAEALLGRGRSSVPPVLAVGLGIVAVISAFSVFSWGRPFLPLAIGGVIVLAVMRRRGRLRHGWGGPGHDWNGGHHDWNQRTDDQVRAWTEQAQEWAESFRASARGSARAGRTARGCGRGRGWGSWSPPGAESVSPGSTRADSPFGQPAFWDRPEGGTGSQPSAPFSGIDLTKTPTSGAGGSTPNDRLLDDPTNLDHPTNLDDPMNLGAPPAWDPLGVAPFAWDLPEPTPLAPPVAAGRRSGGVITRLTLGLTLLTGGLTTAGVFAGWWALAWAQVAGIALGVLGLGLLLSALRGRGYSLIGPGVFLSLVTMALAFTGVSGTSGYGAMDVHPTSIDQLDSSYVAQAGQLSIDLSNLAIPKGTVKNLSVTLKGGHAQVIVPASMTVNATCDAEIGHADCLGRVADGATPESTATQLGQGAAGGTLNVTVKVNAGFAEVANHG